MTPITDTDTLMQHTLGMLRKELDHYGRFPFCRNWSGHPLYDLSYRDPIIGLAPLFMRSAPFAEVIVFAGELDRPSDVPPLGYLPGVDGDTFGSIQAFYRATDLELPFTTDPGFRLPVILDPETWIKSLGYGTTTGPVGLQGTLVSLPASGPFPHAVLEVLRAEWHRRSGRGAMGPWLLLGLLAPMLRLEAQTLRPKRNILDDLEPDTLITLLLDAARMCVDLLPSGPAEEFMEALVRTRSEPCTLTGFSDEVRP